MAKLKDSQLVLAVEDLDPGNGNINRRRYDEDEESPLLRSDLVRDGEFDCFLDPISLERLPWYTRPSVCRPRYCSIL
jgi:hypothetical protein